MKTRTVADLITEDPGVLLDIDYLKRIYADRLCSVGLSSSYALREAKIVEEFDTIGDLDHDYPIFIDSMLKNQDNLKSLTIYSQSDYEAKGAALYKLKGIDAGFAVCEDGDIISVHNSEAKGSPYRGIGRELMQMAIKAGGTKLDHFDFPKLNEIYSQAGFKEYDRVPWDDNYAPEGWNYEKYGRPDLVFRSL